MQTLFNDERMILKIQEKLPYLFQLAESENSRDGKLGMEIGSARERVILLLCFIILVKRMCKLIWLSHKKR